MTEISQALAHRMAKLLDDYDLVNERYDEHWHDKRRAVLRELQPPDPLAEAWAVIDRHLTETASAGSPLDHANAVIDEYIKDALAERNRRKEQLPPGPVAEAVKKVNIMVMQTGEGYSWHDVVAAWSTIKAAVARPSEAWIRADEREKAEADIAEYAKVSAPLLSLDIRAGAYRARATTEATPVNDADHGPQKYAMKGPADYIAEGRKAMYAEMMEWNRRLSPGVAARIMAEGPKP